MQDAFYTHTHTHSSSSYTFSATQPFFLTQLQEACISQLVGDANCMYQGLEQQKSVWWSTGSLQAAPSPHQHVRQPPSLSQQATLDLWSATQHMAGSTPRSRKWEASSCFLLKEDTSHLRCSSLHAAAAFDQCHAAMDRPKRNTQTTAFLSFPFHREAGPKCHSNNNLPMEEKSDKRPRESSNWGCQVEVTIAGVAEEPEQLHSWESIPTGWRTWLSLL